MEHLRRSDLLTDYQLVHLAVVDQYRALLAEIITAATHAAHCAGRVDAAKLAEITSGLCRALFDDDQEINSDAVQRLLAGLDHHAARTRALCQAATAIRAQAATSGGQHRWNFAFVPGTDLDDNSQTPWLDCDPTQPVIAVVTPAYLVDGHVLCHQRVLTRQARDDDRT